MTFTIPPVLRKILFFLAILISGFKGFSQNKLITIHVKNKPISLIIKTIEEQSDFRILYNTRKINADQLADLDVSNATLETALTQLLKDKNISFYIQKKQVLLTSSAPADSSNATSQETERFISGTVYNAKDKQPLPGATIRIKGTGMGAVTDFNGKFAYQLKGNNISNMVLEAGFLGMETQYQKADNKKDFVFYLQEATDELNPVIITSSYGTTKLKEEIVGSISSITAKDIPVQQASESVDKMLEGQIAGVLIENTSGVGGPVKINVRGQGTLKSLSGSILGTSTQPLIIIDGVIMTEEVGIDNDFFNGKGNTAEAFSNPLAMISPDNIESFTVLKDAAAVGIYGADGANGVILITTKKGKKGKAKFTFSNQLGASTAINQIKYLNGEQYNELRNDYLKNTTSGYVPVPYNGINTNWFDLLNNSGIYNKYNFGVSGATSKFSYRTNLTYLNIDEPQLGNETRQFNAGINLGYRHSKWDVNLSLNPSYIKKDAPNIYYDFAYLPILSPYNEDGSYSLMGLTGPTGGNPLAAIEQNKNETETFGILGSLNLGYEFNKNIRFQTLFGIDYKDKVQDRYFSGENESGRTSGSFTLDGITYPNWGRRLLNKRNSTKWNWQGQALFNKEINPNNTIDGVAGFELSQEKTNFNYESAIGFVNPNSINRIQDALQDDNLQTPLIDESKAKQIYSSDINYNSRVSFFAQLNYNYKKKYYVLGNFRRDESSVFGNDSNVALNSGAGLAWVASNENFLKSSSWIDFLKLKISYGSTGNSRIGSYRSKGLYTISQNGYNGNIESSPSVSPNGKLSWEKNTKFNTGFDFNIFNAIEMTLEYYYDDLSDIIASREIPSENGYESVQLNAASMYNKGFEFSTRIKWFQHGKFRWTSSFNISTVDNKVTQLKGLGSDYSTANLALAQKIGYSTSIIWGVNWVGVDPATGRDLIKKDGQVYDAATYARLFSEADWIPIGDSQPKAFGGFNNTFSLNNSITLSITGAFQLGGDKLVSDQIISKYNTTSNRNMSVNAYDYWRNPGDIVSQPAPSNNTLIANMSKYIYDATYVKISNINLSYNVPVKNTFLDSLTVFADVSNALYWYKEKSPAGRNGIREFSFTYPQARTISCGINTKF
ncbi:SusC/RagA family TonB-linked outer membrane protein [Flavobacterium endoglycinae]|uniref:SusC/RagA family TonB-linked outer membrane protein n=1 Tax=Flavobacterium endoglycinae TaxID=2816357 RepID=A0ABX7QEC0_9FLAO|nr:SusC/RagA family TonB-linked outer membrane protein [Flavobacterium endoglycinae]QSW89391.1 SusC/RagA family TonB-linked outer membrane protein [Flavobacterium endoglycinae]